MSELQRNDQDESLKSLGRLQVDTLDFDVTDPVMKRVYLLSSQKSRMNRQFRLRPVITLTSVTLLFALGVSVTGYAASQYLEFRNQHGDVVLKTSKPDEPTKFVQTYSERLTDFSSQVRNQLKPGEYAAYYIKDDAMNKADQANPVKFEYKWVEYTNFSRFQDEMKRTEAPFLTDPRHLPLGYRFDYGYVYPDYMQSMGGNKSEYEKLRNELIRKSETAADGENVIIKKLDWRKANASIARFTKGNDYVNVTVSHLSPSAGLITVFQGEQDKAEKLTIGGTETYYIHSDSNSSSLQMKNRIGWKDDENQLLYTIFDNLGSKLTKEDFVKLAEDFIASH